LIASPEFSAEIAEIIVAIERQSSNTLVQLSMSDSNSSMPLAVPERVSFPSLDEHSEGRARSSCPGECQMNDRSSAIWTVL
jgi:hypothetical protein